MDKILLTGSSGFLGKSMINKLANGYDIISLSRASGDYKVSLEIEEPNFVQKFDLIIHAAGKAHSIPKTKEEAKLFYDVNVNGTINLLKGLNNVGKPNQFVFISSVAVYGQENGCNIDEKHSLDAKDPYGLSKIKAELLVTEWCEKYNVICTILRLPLLVGQNPTGNLGAMVKAIDKGYYFNIGGGKAKKSMLLAEDVAIFILKVASIGGIYNLTDGAHPNFQELSGVISKKKNKRIPLNLPLYVAKVMGFVGDLLGNKAPINSLKIKKITSDLTFNDTKAKLIGGWKPQEVLEYLKNNNLE